MLCPNCKQDFTTRFCTSCGYARPTDDNATEVAAAPPVYQPQPIIVNNIMSRSRWAGNQVCSPKNRWVALVLCFCLGFLGVHRFYTGKILTGFLYFFTLGLGFVGVAFDFFMILFGIYTDKGHNFLDSSRPFSHDD